MTKTNPVTAVVTATEGNHVTLTYFCPRCESLHTLMYFDPWAAGDHQVSKTVCPNKDRPVWLAIDKP